MVQSYCMHGKQTDGDDDDGDDDDVDKDVVC